MPTWDGAQATLKAREEERDAQERDRQERVDKMTKKYNEYVRSRKLPLDVGGRNIGTLRCLYVCVCVCVCVCMCVCQV